MSRIVDLELFGADRVQKALQDLTGPQLTRALSMALNRTADKGQAEVNRAVRERYAIKASEVRNSVVVRRASSGALVADIQIFGSAKKRGRSMNMIHFMVSKPRSQAGVRVDKRRPLNFRVIRGGALKQVAGAFVANDGRTVFSRVGKERLPIEPVQVIGVSQMFNFGPIQKRVLDKVRGEFTVELERAIGQVLRTRGGA